MIERSDMPTTAQEVAVMKQEVLGPDSGVAYMQDLNVALQDTALVVDLQKLRYVYDLLTRNLVNAANMMGEQAFIDATGDTYKEIINDSYELLEQDAITATDHNAIPAIKDIQHRFNSPLTELGHTVDVSLRVQLIDALMFANAQLLTDEHRRSQITQHRQLEYYLENIVGAYYHIRPHQ